MHAIERRNRWTWALMAVLVGGTLVASPVEAGLRARCRAACKPLLTGCATIGKSKRACKRAILRGCRVEGVAFCDLGSVTTTTTSQPKTTTTTLPPAPGKVVLHVDDISRDGSTDPGRYDFLVTVTGDADSLPVSLEPTAFYVLDGQDVRYEAVPAVEVDDCSSDDVVTPGGSVTCSVHFTLPLVVGWDEEQGGQGYGQIFFETGGYRRWVYFKVHPSGWGTIS
jgi:hypothetical protein